MFSCTPAHEKAEDKQQVTDISGSYSNTDSLEELTEEQQSAFDALNTLQTNTDEMNRLYSTFANLVQPCYPADTSMVITQSELLVFMKQFISRHCKNLQEEVQNQLAASSVLAQEEYKVLYCSKDSSLQNYENGLPMVGTWVIPGVLGRRDIIIVW